MWFSAKYYQVGKTELAGTERTEFVDSIFEPAMSVRKAAPKKRTFVANF